MLAVRNTAVPTNEMQNDDVLVESNAEIVLNLEPKDAKSQEQTAIKTDIGETSEDIKTASVLQNTENLNVEKVNKEMVQDLEEAPDNEQITENINENIPHQGFQSETAQTIDEIKLEPVVLENLDVQEAKNDLKNTEKVADKQEPNEIFPQKIKAVVRVPILRKQRKNKRKKPKKIIIRRDSTTSTTESSSEAQDQAEKNIENNDKLSENNPMNSIDELNISANENSLLETDEQVEKPLALATPKLSRKKGYRKPNQKSQNNVQNENKENEKQNETLSTNEENKEENSSKINDDKVSEIEEEKFNNSSSPSANFEENSNQVLEITTVQITSKEPIIDKNEADNKSQTDIINLNTEQTEKQTLKIECEDQNELESCTEIEQSDTKKIEKETSPITTTKIQIPQNKQTTVPVKKLSKIPVFLNRSISKSEPKSPETSPSKIPIKIGSYKPNTKVETTVKPLNKINKNETETKNQPNGDDSSSSSENFEPALETNLHLQRTKSDEIADEMRNSVLKVKNITAQLNNKTQKTDLAATKKSSMESTSSRQQSYTKSLDNDDSESSVSESNVEELLDPSTEDEYDDFEEDEYDEEIIDNGESNSEEYEEFDKKNEEIVNELNINLSQISAKMNELTADLNEKTVNHFPNQYSIEETCESEEYLSDEDEEDDEEAEDDDELVENDDNLKILNDLQIEIKQPTELEIMEVNEIANIRIYLIWNQKKKHKFGKFGQILK